MSMTAKEKATFLKLLFLIYYYFLLLHNKLLIIYNTLKMKQIILLIFFSFQLTAQTSYGDADISAMAGTKYETLLTNVVYVEYDDFSIFKLLKDLNYNTIDYSQPVKGKSYITIRYDKENNNNESVYASYFVQNINNVPITTKIEIYGNVKTIITFFVSFWSTSLNFDDVKVGEIVSCRFLSDVATLSFLDNKTAKITVVSSKDRYKNNTK